MLDNFCFPLSEPQFKHLLGKLQVYSDNQVDYTAFIGEFKQPETVSHCGEFKQPETVSYCGRSIPELTALAMQNKFLTFDDVIVFCWT